MMKQHTRYEKNTMWENQDEPKYKPNLYYDFISNSSTVQNTNTMTHPNLNVHQKEGKETVTTE